ncbi:hypothetical protein KJ980_05790 [Patescibacteria group bacterium]|nr:hypothetical protein [Patescibacteria group bacterium]MBU4016512.1 hypothetical protein [Patescibacteria group bacterium]MBU4099131.1 hypothetical protein [Patescibacteria group bacterium]
MPKKKKTRKQKILADKRNITIKMQSQQVVDPGSNPIIEHKTQPPLKQDQQSIVQVISPSQYHYVYSDLIKTVILTLSIFAGELILAYFFIWRLII